MVFADQPRVRNVEAPRSIMKSPEGNHERASPREPPVPHAGFGPRRQACSIGQPEVPAARLNTPRCSVLRRQFLRCLPFVTIAPNCDEDPLATELAGFN